MADDVVMLVHSGNPGKRLGVHPSVVDGYLEGDWELEGGGKSKASKSRSRSSEVPGDADDQQSGDDAA